MKMMYKKMALSKEGNGPMVVCGCIGWSGLGMIKHL